MKKCFALCLALVSMPVVASCPPGTVARGVYTKYCYPVATGSSSSGGGSSYGGTGAQMGREIGGVLGGLIRESLFGTPQQNAEHQAALAAQRQWEEQERQRLAAERARQEDERYQRLRTSLLDFNPGPQLSLMGTQPGGGLQLMLGDAAEQSTNPAFAQLTRAAAWSTLAAQANTPEESAMFADAAFQSLIGEKINLPPPPPDVKGVPVGPVIKDVEPLKKEYLELRPQVPAAARPVLDAEYRKELAAHAEEEANFMARKGATLAIRTHGNAVLKDAKRVREQAEADLKKAQEQLAQRQASVNGVAQQLRNVAASLAGPATGATTPRVNGFFKGFQDGSLCFSQSAANFCRQAAPGDVNNCEGAYRQGYAAGENIKQQVLKNAYERGQQDKRAGRNYADTEAETQGSCRYEYIMSYNTGYFGWRISYVNK